MQLKIYDANGREITELVNAQQAPSEYAVQFNGAGLASGVYFYRIRVDSFVEQGKMVLIR